MTTGIFALLNSISTNKSLGEDKKDAKYMTINQNVLLGYDSSASNECFQNDINTVTILFQGEIYNKTELYSMLQIEPSTSMESEIIYHLYSLYGMEKALKLLDGVYSFVLYDSNLYNQDFSFTQKIYIVRDPLGVKPLFIFTKNGSSKKDIENSIGFSSNKAAFIPYFESKDNCDIADFPPGTFSKYELSFKTFSEWTLVLENQSFYSPPPMFTTAVKYDMDHVDWYVQGIQVHLEEVIKKQCRYTVGLGVGVGCLLSGGFKSSLIAALVNKEIKNINRMLDSDMVLRTYSIGFAGSLQLKQARETAEYLGTDHQEIIVEESDVYAAIRDVISVVETSDKKTVRETMGKYLIGRWIEENVDDVDFLFHGDGGDALCGGYLYMSEMDQQIDFEMETRRLLETTRSPSYRRIKTMAPFMDVFFVNYYLSIPLHLRSQNVLGKNCHYLLRKAFSTDYLHDELLSPDILRREKAPHCDNWLCKNDLWFFEMVENNMKCPDSDSDSPLQYIKNREQDIEEALYSYHYDSLFPELSEEKEKEKEKDSLDPLCCFY
jgi:asparagine synthase (glutamine-hydrolysing)